MAGLASAIDVNTKSGPPPPAAAAGGFYWDKEGKVEKYIASADGYDGASLIALLDGALPAGSRVLEVGMGPGKDQALLSAAGYVPTGSDLSEVFVKRYRQLHPEADVLQLDAVTLALPPSFGSQFDCIYSNKALISLDTAQLAASFRRQAEVLRAADGGAGLVLHSFWLGEGSEVYDGMPVHYRSEKELRGMLADEWDIVAAAAYAEMDFEDSLYVLARVQAR